MQKALQSEAYFGFELDAMTILNQSEGDTLPESFTWTETGPNISTSGRILVGKHFLCSFSGPYFDRTLNIVPKML